MPLVPTRRLVGERKSMRWNKKASTDTHSPFCKQSGSHGLLDSLSAASLSSSGGSFLADWREGFVTDVGPLSPAPQDHDAPHESAGLHFSPAPTRETPHTRTLTLTRGWTKRVELLEKLNLL